MKPARMITLAGMTVGVILSACTFETNSNPSPAFTLPPPTGTSSPLPTSTITLTSTLTSTPTFINCIPETADYCIVDPFFTFQRPIAPPGTDKIDRSYPYGSTEGKTRPPHHGVEFYNPSGMPVLAAATGTVYFAGNDTGRLFSPWSNFYGNLVVLKHELPGTTIEILYTLYAHLSKVEVATDQVVTAGQKIGEVGTSGSAQGSHLHFEVRIDPQDYGSTLNPELWLSPHPGNGTLSLLAIDQNGKSIFPFFNIQYFPDRSTAAIAAFPVDSYSTETVNTRDPWNEIAALGDQPAGWYRVTFIWQGVLYERWAEIQAGGVTRMFLRLK